MNYYDYSKVTVGDCFLGEKQELNRKVTMRAVYDRFAESGRFDAFRCDWREGQPNKPHIFWDSDVAKWMEAAAYVLRGHPDPDLQKKIEDLIDLIEKNQGEDGYFNIYYTAVEPSRRFTDRRRHELYCAGHLIEAAVAYAESTGRVRFLRIMEKYARYIRRVFCEEKSAAFVTPGHEEIELALIRLYRFTGKKEYLDTALFFLDRRGREEADLADPDVRAGQRRVPWEPNFDYNQSHAPVREQREARGHAVRATYLYSAMADAAFETGDAELAEACDCLYEDITRRKMYVTGGIGSTSIGEAFTNAYDLPNAEAYTETCAAIGLVLFCRRMAQLHDRAEYADVIERCIYNGILSGLSLDGERFFYENPLEIDLSGHFRNDYGEKRYPLTQRPRIFSCSCCPPNINRFLASLGGLIYAEENGTLYVNQFVASVLEDGERYCRTVTDYPVTGKMIFEVRGFERIAVRIPSYAGGLRSSAPFTEKDGYAVIETETGETTIECEIPLRSFPVRSCSRVTRDVGRICVQRGPVVYCAEAVDNDGLFATVLSPDFAFTESQDPRFGLPVIDADAVVLESDGKLYVDALREPVSRRKTKLRLIPYYAFANRGESDMRVWF